MKEKKQSATFYYGALRDILGLISSLLWAIALFFPWKYFVRCLGILAYGDILPSEKSVDIFVSVLLWSYVLIYLLILIKDILDIYITTLSYLIVSKNQVTLHYGWLTKRTVTIPANKIRTCVKSSGIIQRLCDTMDIHITTAGDSHEISFANIIDGDRAYNLICELAGITTVKDTNEEDDVLQDS